MINWKVLTFHLIEYNKINIDELSYNFLSNRLFYLLLNKQSLYTRIHWRIIMLTSLVPCTAATLPQHFPFSNSCKKYAYLVSLPLHFHFWYIIFKHLECILCKLLFHGYSFSIFYNFTWQYLIYSLFKIYPKIRNLLT